MFTSLLSCLSRLLILTSNKTGGCYTDWISTYRSRPSPLTYTSTSCPPPPVLYLLKSASPKNSLLLPIMSALFTLLPGAKHGFLTATDLLLHRTFTKQHRRLRYMSLIRGWILVIGSLRLLFTILRTSKITLAGMVPGPKQRPIQKWE